jgi:hypothetical protein
VRARAVLAADWMSTAVWTDGWSAHTGARPEPSKGEAARV